MLILSNNYDHKRGKKMVNIEWNQIIPEFDVKNLEKSLNFYVNLIGFEIIYERKEDRFVFLQYEKVQIMLQEINDEKKWETGVLEYPFGRGINFQIDIKDVDGLYSRFLMANYPIFVEKEVHSYRVDDNVEKCSEFLVKDPDGYLIRFSGTI